MDLSTLGRLALGFAIALLVTVTLVSAVSFGLSRWALATAVASRASQGGVALPFVLGTLGLLLTCTAAVGPCVGLLTLRGDAFVPSLVALGIAFSSAVHAGFQLLRIRRVLFDARYLELAQVPFSAGRDAELWRALQRLGLPRFEGSNRLEALALGGGTLLVAAVTAWLLTSVGR